MEILPRTAKKVPGVVIPEKVKLALFVQAYTLFNRSLYFDDPDPVVVKWAELGDAKYAEICWTLWELGLYEEFSQSIEKDVRKKYEILTA